MFHSMFCIYAVYCIILKGMEIGCGLLGYPRCRFTGVFYKFKY